MKLKKLWALLLCLTLMLVSVSFTVTADDTNNVTVTITVSKYGKLLDEATLVPVELSGKGAYTLDDVFQEAHNLYYSGDDGYASDIGEYGAYITKFWGDESGNFGYQINGGEKYVGGLDTFVDNGDFVDVTIYKNKYPETEIYTKFNTYKAEACAGKNSEMTIYQAGYDENWNMVFSPCEGAIVTACGTEYISDINGKIELIFDEAGTYIVTAYKTKVVKDSEVAEITAPVCQVTVKEPYAVMLDNIADLYSGERILSDINMIWFLADMEVYNKLYPEKALTEDVKKLCVNRIIADATTSSKPNVLAKSIIALRALGYDAREVYDKGLKKVDIVSKLTALIDEKSEDVTDVYTISYVLLALNQGENYASSQQIEYLIDEIIKNKDLWQKNEWGTDAASAVLLALAPYYGINENVKSVVDETILIIKENQSETGTIGNAASTGLAIVALSAYGIDSSEIIKNEFSLVDGLMNLATDEIDGFIPVENSFSTEQGFRGLLAWELFKNDMGFMYDFKLNPMNIARATWEPEGCPVIFNVTPENADVKITDIYSVEKNKYDLSNGVYTYVVTADGYKTKTETIIVTPDEAENHILKNISISLEKKSSSVSSGGGGGFIRPDKEEIKEDIKEEIKKEEVKTEILFDETVFNDVKADDWYYDSVKYVYENSLMQGTENGFEAEKEMTRAMLVTVLYRMENPEHLAKESNFVDIKMGEWYSDAVIWAADNDIVSGVADGIFAPDDYITREQMAVILYRYAKLKEIDTGSNSATLSFEDSLEISDWAVNALKWANDAKIINGTSALTISPKETATRAQVATILMRFSESFKNDSK